eukprot:scaffold20973_cov53-Phaeocystis_antarctica.AAC.7
MRLSAEPSFASDTSSTGTQSTTATVSRSVAPGGTLSAGHPSSPSHASPLRKLPSAGVHHGSPRLSSPTTTLASVSGWKTVPSSRAPLHRNVTSARACGGTRRRVMRTARLGGEGNGQRRAARPLPLHGKGGGLACGDSLGPSGLDDGAAQQLCDLVHLHEGEGVQQGGVAARHLRRDPHLHLLAHAHRDQGLLHASRQLVAADDDTLRLALVRGVEQGAVLLLGHVEDVRLPALARVVVPAARRQ